MGEQREREQLRQEAERIQRKAQDDKIAQIVEDAKKNYASVQELFKTEPWKALLVLRGKLRRIRSGWLEKMLDVKVPHNEKDMLLGQYNAILLIFDLLEQIKEINKGMVPGHEAEYIREKLFKNPNSPQSR